MREGERGVGVRVCRPPFPPAAPRPSRVRTRRWQMALWVFVRSPHAVDITNVTHGDLPTGIAV